MSQEVKIHFALEYADSNGARALLDLAENFASVTTKKYIRMTQSIGTTEEALDLGELGTSIGWSAFVNRDVTNYLELRSATGASNDIIKIPAGMGCLFHWGSDVTAPFAIANTAACILEFVICST